MHITWNADAEFVRNPRRRRLPMHSSLLYLYIAKLGGIYEHIFEHYSKMPPAVTLVEESIGPRVIEEWALLRRWLVSQPHGTLKDNTAPHLYMAWLEMKDQEPTWRETEAARRDLLDAIGICVAVSANEVQEV